MKKVGKERKKVGEKDQNLIKEESVKVIPWFCTAHNIATSNDGAVIFTCRLKRGYHMYGPFCSPNAFHSKVCLETRPSPLA